MLLVMVHRVPATGAGNVPATDADDEPMPPLEPPGGGSSRETISLPLPVRDELVCFPTISRDSRTPREFDMLEQDSRDSASLSVFRSAP